MRPHLCVLALAVALFPGLAASSETRACEGCEPRPSAEVSVDGDVVDCRRPSGRIDLLTCDGERLASLEEDMESHYARLLRSFDDPSPEGMNHDVARAALIESQQAWRRYAREDCAVGAALFGLGNAGPEAGLDCMIRHVEARIARLREHLGLDP